MTDRELLELAAKAAGYDIKPHSNYKISRDLIFTYSGKNWNPLTDDGDVLRLAVKLNILTYQTGGDRSYASTPMNWSCTVPHYNNDALTSTRRAIVLAAAEIGKTMP